MAMRLSTLCLGACLFASGTLLAHASDVAPTPSGLRLKASSVEPSQSSGRYTMRARFAAEEKGGELREGGDFVLIGRIAKGGVVCTPTDTLFRDGFEGS
jgi:hypothetical protein